MRTYRLILIKTGKVIHNLDGTPFVTDQKECATGAAKILSKRYGEVRVK